ncbi:GNAT family N-acetyltransferase [Fundidesulfovibrio butyratiphilus]
MNIRVQYDCANIEWALVADILKRVGMAHHAPEVHARAFARSHTVVFVHDDDRLIGFGRAISDGEYQAAVYDCAVLPEYQGKAIGSMLVKALLQRVEGCNVILYAAPGKEGFYEKLGFGKMKTGMARFVHQDAMRDKGFLV